MTPDLNNINGEVGENWFWVDMDLDKYIYCEFTSVCNKSFYD